MSKQPHANLIDQIDLLISDKDNRVIKFQKIKVAMSELRKKEDALKKAILEDNDSRFIIAEETTRETAPNAKQFVEIFGQEMFDQHKNISTVKRHVKGIK